MIGKGPEHVGRVEPAAQLETVIQPECYQPNEERSMTKLAILADIHGVSPALDAVIEDMHQFKVDHVVVAGDLISFGPFSQQVVERVVENGWSVIRGNNEFFLVDYRSPRAPSEWDDPIRFSLLPWLSRQLDDHWKHSIASWPDSLQLRYPDAPPIRVVHGTPRSPWEALLPTMKDDEISHHLAGVDEGTVIAAHSHLPMDKNSGKWHLINPGSVGVPLDGTFSASYVLIDGDDRGWKAHFRRVPFDYDPIYREFERTGFVEECGLIGMPVSYTHLTLPTN